MVLCTPNMANREKAIIHITEQATFIKKIKSQRALGSAGDPGVSREVGRDSLPALFTKYGSKRKSSRHESDPARPLSYTYEEVARVRAQQRGMQRHAHWWQAGQTSCSRRGQRSCRFWSFLLPPTCIEEIQLYVCAWGRQNLTHFLRINSTRTAKRRVCEQKVHVKIQSPLTFKSKRLGATSCSRVRDLWGEGKALETFEYEHKQENETAGAIL